jgi:formylglycine-generating enzyme required for sulfatase activity
MVACRLAAVLSAMLAVPAGGAETPKAPAEIGSVNMPALRRAVEDLSASYPDRYGAKGYLARLEGFERQLPEILKAIEAGRADAAERAASLLAFRQEALLANPLLDFDKLLVVKRGLKGPALGLPQNWQGNSCLPRGGYDDEVAVLSPVRPGGALTTCFKPAGPRFVGDVELHFDANRMMFSMPDDKGRWQVFEVGLDASTGRADAASLKQVTPGEPADVDNFDACYLPDGRVIYASTACMQGVPCVQGSSFVANLFLLDRPTGGVRQLCFDQDHNWCATMLPNGRVLYLRWEYTDLPHAFNRILFTMNPDGSGQSEYYGSNSYWPNGIFYARPIGGESTKFVGIVTGHHGVPRMGELVLFDTARGRHEADGAIQRISQYGKKVEPILKDELVDASWPKFLHPYPLSDKYMLTAAQLSSGSPWCIYLVDVFDNMLELARADGSALLEPLPLRRTPAPPIVPDRVEPARKDAVVYLTDVYAGPGLTGVPRGTVKKLRLFTYHFAYRGMGGQQDRVGLDGPWDIKRVIGTVPVRPDGSATFRVPANTPISVQPLDEAGQAIQIMRSWFTAMPGENLSCVGCHERQDQVPAPAPQPSAMADPPSEISPFHGPVRGFDFRREVQPVLDGHCIGCHDGRRADIPEIVRDLRDAPDIVVHPIPNQHGMGRYSPSYYAVRRFVRTPTIESDLHLLPAYEFTANTTKLVQMLRKGHHKVALDAEAWERLITWIDLGGPAHGTWTETVGADRTAGQHARRMEMRKLYAAIDEDPEAIVNPYNPPASPPKAPQPEPVVAAGAVACAGWPFDAAEAARRQAQGGPHTRTIDLGGAAINLVRIPAGAFVMGDDNGQPDERPASAVKIDRAFWMATTEITNEQYRLFDPSHDSRLERGAFLQFSQAERGFDLNTPRQPVVRVSWLEAMAFCRWLSEKTGQHFTLPTEAQWEYACRAGTATPLSYGDVGVDHGKLANLADINVKQMSVLGFGLPHGAIPAWHPTDGKFNDGARVSAEVGKYLPNAWGLHDMHGNVSEWTRSDYRPYPYLDDDGRNGQSPTAPKVVRGGSWYDRPIEARSGFRLSYLPHQGVYDVGFRVICEPPPAAAPAVAGAAKK